MNELKFLLCLFAVGAHALPTKTFSHHLQPARTLRLSGGSPLLSKSRVFDVATGLFGVEGAAQTFFAEQTGKMYCPGVKNSPEILFLIESWGEKNLVSALIIFLLRWKSYPLLSALSYALVVDAFYDGHVLLNHAGKIGLDMQLISSILVLKVIVAVLGFNNGFGKIKPDHIIRTMSVFWTIFGLFGLASTNQALKSIGIKDLDARTKTMSRGLWISILSLGAFLWFYDQSDALALAISWGVWSLNFAYSVATQEWRVLQMPNGVCNAVWTAVCAFITYSAAAHA